jgi:Recombination enhancement, RecA-dependent nuclease
MQHSTKTPSKAEVAHFRKLQLLGCIACLIEGVFPQCGHPEMHHMLSGNKRRGHAFVLPLGAWHHRGVRPQWMPSDKEAKFFYGPSLAHGSKPFTARYGTQDQLHAKITGMIGGTEAAT